MKDHERAAREAAFNEAMGICGNHNSHYAMWEAGRKYKPPAVCGARHLVLSCTLLDGHLGDHRDELFDEGKLRHYIGWPRT